jgi:trigger factor
VKTTATLLDDDRARLEIEVPPDRLEHDIEHTLHHLAHNVRIPGFRKGKVPPRIVYQRLGREEVLDETLREHLSRWYSDGVEVSPVKPVGRPEIDWERLPAEGEPFVFSAVVKVRPKGTLPDELALEAVRDEATLPEEALDAELERLRLAHAPLTAVEGRPAQLGDFVEIDFSASVNGRRSEGATAQGYHAELGSGRLLDGIEEGVVGMSAGETRDVTVGFPEDYPNSAFAGREAVFTITLHGISQRDPQPLGDQLARQASEFDTLTELRDDIAGVLRGRLDEQVAARYRSAVLDALGRVVEVELPDELIDEKTDELLYSLARGFERRGVSLDTWLQSTGKSPDEVRDELRPDAVDALRKEIALESLAERESVTVDDETLERTLREDAADQDDAEQLVQELLASDAKERVREDLRLRLALDRATELATPITPEKAAARPDPDPQTSGT